MLKELIDWEKKMLLMEGELLGKFMSQNQSLRYLVSKSTDVIFLKLSWLWNFSHDSQLLYSQVLSPSSSSLSTVNDYFISTISTISTLFSIRSKESSLAYIIILSSILRVSCPIPSMKARIMFSLRYRHWVAQTSVKEELIKLDMWLIMLGFFASADL